MWIVRNGKIVIMAQDTRRGGKLVYIPERKWIRLTDEQRARYSI